MPAGPPAAHHPAGPAHHPAGSFDRGTLAGRVRTVAPVLVARN
jgi:hypothetical protein